MEASTHESADASQQPAKAKFVKPTKDLRGVNAVAKHASAALRSERAQVDAQLSVDVQKVLEGGCVYLPAFLCVESDLSTLLSLTEDLKNQPSEGMIDWSRHLKHENPSFSPTFNGIVQRLSDHFDVDIYATRLNFYRDNSDWKPWHHDSHAYGGRQQREDFTIGASFGGARALAFLHEPSGIEFSFPQRNGDVFAFDTEVNERFKHGVPRATGPNSGPRFSIIAWGRRRTLNERNASPAAIKEWQRLQSEAEKNGTAQPLRDGGGGGGNRERPGGHQAPPPAPPPGRTNERVMDSSQVADLVHAMVSGGGAGAGTDAGPRRTQSAVAKLLRADLGTETYGELKSLARAWQHGELATGELVAHARHYLGGDLGPLLDLAAFLPDLEMRRELALAAALSNVQKEDF